MMEKWIEKCNFYILLWLEKCIILWNFGWKNAKYKYVRKKDYKKDKRLVWCAGSVHIK